MPYTPYTPMSLLSIDDLLAIAEKDLPLYGLDLEKLHDLLPCSPAQARMLAASSEEDPAGGTAYITQARASLRGGVHDLDRYQRAWNAVIADCPVLRTVFFQVGGHAATARRDLFYAGAVLEEMHVPISIIKNEEGEAMMMTADDLARSELDSLSCMPFGKPMLRMAALEEGAAAAAAAGDFHFVLTIHQVLHDALSLDLILGDVQRAYDESTTTTVPRADHALYIRHLQQNSDVKLAQRYWSEHLNGFAGMAFPALPQMMFQPRASASATVERTLVAAARFDGFSAEDLLAAAWAVVLSKHAGTDDVCFGRLIHNRPTELGLGLGLGLDHTITGPTQNVIPCRLTVDDSASVRELITAVASFAVESGPHRFLDIDHIKKLIPAVATTAALFSTLLDVSQQHSREETSPPSRPDFVISSDDVDCSVAIHAQVTAAGPIELRVAYDPRVLERQNVYWLVEHLCAAFEELATAADNLTVGGISAVSLDELNTQIFTWNPEDRMLADPRCCIHELVEREARRRPDKIAVEFLDGLRLTYAEMNTKANRLARKLRTLGVGPEIIVPVCMRRSVYMVVAVLAVLKAGGAYIPLDVDTPHARNLHIIEAAKATLLVTNNDDAAEVQDYGVTVVVADSDYPSLEADDINLDVKDVGVTDTNLAYIIFTSGSTGNPKGAMIEHRNIVAASRGFTDRYAHGPADRRLNFAQFTFDDCVMDFFATLTTGGTLCMAPKGEYNVAKVIRRMEITFLATTPSVLALLHPEDCPTMRAMDVGGEPMLPQVVKRWAGKIHLGNAYGPTETCCLSHSHRHSVDEKEIHLIGHPFYTAQTYILDEQLRVVPVGCVGEICIGGPQVGRGYFGQPELSARTYLDHPELGVRIYRSGDLGRYHHDGRVVCMGRMDNQVKLFGLRIELGEIESVVQRITAVKYVSAMKTTIPGEKFPRIVCFLSFETTNDESDSQFQNTACPVTVLPCSGRIAEVVEQAKDICTKHLPYYMIPTRWIPLSRLPFNKNGKIDAKTLRASTHLLQLHNTAAATLAAGGEAPAAELLSVDEERVRDVLAPLCDADKTIGREESLTKLGLDSVARVMLVQNLRTAFNRPEFAIADIWNHPTIALLAAFLVGATSDVVSKEAIPAVTTAESGPVKTQADLRRILLQTLGKDESLIKPGQSFSEMGLSSIGKLMFVSTVRKELGVAAFKFVDLLDYPTLEALTVFIDELKDAPAAALAPPMTPLHFVDTTITATAGVPEAGGNFKGSTIERLRSILVRFLRINASDISPWTPLTETGLSSMSKIAFVTAIRKELGFPKLKFVDLLENSTIETLAAFIDAQQLSISSLAAAATLPTSAAGPMADPLPVEQTIRWALSQVLVRNEADIAPNENFITMGLSSMAKIALVTLLRKKLPLPSLRFVDLLEHSTVTKLAAFARLKLESIVAKTSLPKGTAKENSTEATVRIILQKVLPKGSIVTADATFVNSALTSIGMVRFVSFLRKEFGAPTLRGVDVYDHPTVAKLSAFLNERYPRTSTPLAVAVPERPAKNSSRSELKCYPMSGSQQRMWLAQNTYNDTSYQILHVRNVEIAFHPPTLQKALNVLGRRHEILRTTYDLDTEHGLVQIVNPELNAPFAVVDFSGSRDPEEDIKNAIRADFRNPFDLAVDAPVRVIVFAVAPLRHVVYIVCHHIAVDEWSHGLLMTELSDVYLALASNEQPSDQPADYQYSDFLSWQANVLSVQRESQLAYWEGNLEGCEPLQLSPTADTSGSPEKGLLGFMQVDLDREIADGFSKLCASSAVTTAVGWLTIYNMMMIEQSGSRDFAVLLPSTHRGDMEGSLDVVGCCLNSVILRCRATERDGFKELLAQAKQTMNDALRHGDVAFEDVVHHVFGDRSLGVLRKLRSAFSMVTEGEAGQEQQIWSSEFHLSFEGGDPQGDLDFYLIVADEKTRVRICYNRALYGPESVRALAARFEEITRAVTEGQNTMPCISSAAAGSPAAHSGAFRQCPASPNQLRMWASQRISQDSSYNLPYLAVLDFVIDEVQMQSAVDRLIQRHEILRTTYAIDPITKKLVQKIASAFTVRCDAGDFSLLSDPMAAVRTRCIEDNRKPFDLAEGVARFGVYKTSTNTSALYINVHHIAVDEYSLNHLYQQIGELYADPGQPAHVEGLAQYAEVCALQYAVLHGDGGGEYARQRNFWKEYLSGARSLDFPRDAVGTGHTPASLTTEVVKIPAPVLAAFERAVHAEHCSTFTACLAVFEALMYRTCGQEDFTTLIPISNRGDLEGSDSAIGCMTNTVALRTTINPERTFRSMLHAATSNLNTILRHADIPYEEVLRIHTAASTSEQDGVMFSYMCDEGAESTLAAGPKSEELAIPQEGAPSFALLFSVQKVADAALISIEFDSSLFSMKAMAALATNFLELIRSVTVNIVQRLRDTPASVVEPEPTTLSTSTSDSVSVALGCVESALKLGSRDLFDSALDAGSREVAHCLIANGVEAGDAVPIVATSLALCVGLLGIVKARASAVVVDQAASPELTRRQLETFAAKVILTTREHGQLPMQGKTVLMDMGEVTMLPSPPSSVYSTASTSSTPATRESSPEPSALSYTEGSDDETLHSSTSGSPNLKPADVHENAGELAVAAASAKRQSILREAWSVALGVDPATITHSTSFFEVGGHSLIAIIMCEDLSSSGHHLKYLDVFKNPKLADMAECVELSALETKELSLAQMKLPEPPKKVKHTEVEPFSIVGLNNTSAKATYGSELSALGLDFADVEDIYPASPLQTGLIALSAQSGQYMATFSYRLVGHVEPEKMRAAFSQIVSRNPILRTSFFYPQIDQNLMQIVRKPNVTQLQWTTSTASRARFERMVHDEREIQQAKPFQLGGQYMRCALVTTADHFAESERETVLLWTIHHALFDAISLDMCLQDLFQAYAGKRLEAREPYAKFIRHISARDQGLSFYEKYLRGAVPTQFPARIPGNSGAKIESRPKAVRVTVPVNLQRFTRDHSILGGTFLKACWGLVLMLHANADDVLFGFVSSGREMDIPDTNAQNIVGPTLNTIITRIRKTAPTTTAMEFLRELQEESLAQLEYSHTGLRDVKAVIKTSPDVALFSTLLNFGGVTGGEVESPSDLPFAVKSEEGAMSVNYPIIAEISARANELAVTLGFDAAIVQEDEVSQLATNFSNVLENMATISETTLISDVSFMNASVLPDTYEGLGAADPGPPPRFEFLHQAFEFYAYSAPDRVALHLEDLSTISYGELNRKANRLARALRQRGVVRNDMVPVCIDKSADMVVALFAVLKAGAGYVPLDPHSPQARHQVAIDKTDAKLVVTKAAHRGVFGPCGGVDVLCVDEDWGESTLSGDAIPAFDRRPDDVAYVIMTSGTTGTPKGCVIEHRAAVHAMAALAQETALHITSSSRVLQFANYTFDASISDFFITLGVGARLCIACRETLLYDLTETIQAFEANWVMLTPSVAALLDPVDVPTMKTLILVGEPIRADVVAQWLGKARIGNGYGPSEAAEICVMQEVKEADAQRSVIGRPIGFTKLWILSENMGLVPPGGAGELYLESVQLARGYLKDPVLTKRAFISHPFKQGQRLYRTGDIVRQLPDGQIECLGRKDSQIKLHGLRIELSEIECAIQREPAVSYACVNLWQEQLVAYIVPKTQSTKSPSAGAPKILFDSAAQTQKLVSTIKKRISTHLAPYMIPHRWIPVDSIPLSPSGKTDHRTLTALLESHSASALMSLVGAASKDAPETPNEILMASWWAQILAVPVESIDRADSFFALGGDSVSLVRLSQIARRNGQQFDIAAAYENSQLHEFSGNLRAISTDGEAGQIERLSLLTHEDLDPATVLNVLATEYDLVDSAIEDVYPATELQTGMIAQTLRSPGAYMLQDTLDIKGTSFDPKRFESAWRTLCQKHAGLRTTFAYVANRQGIPVLVQVVQRESSLHWTNTRCSPLALGKCLADAEAETPVKLGDDFMSFTLIRVDEHHFKFVWKIHHALTDAWFISQLMDDLSAAYRGDSISDRPLYKSYIKYLYAQDRAASLEYFESALAGVQKTAYPRRDAATTHTAADARAEFAIRVTAKFEQFTTEHNVTIANLFRTCWAIVLSHHAHSDDVLFGCLNSGREIPVDGVSEMIGLCIHTVPVRVSLDKKADLLTLMREEQKSFSTTVRHGLLGLRAIRRLVPDVQGSLFDTVVNYRGSLQSKADQSPFPFQVTGETSRTAQNYPLVIDVDVVDSHMNISACYDAAILEKSEVAILLRHLAAAVTSVVNDPSTTVDQVNLCDEEERRGLEMGIRSVDRLYEPTAGLHQLFEQQVARTPNSVAVMWGRGTLTYREVNHRANLLAALLQKSGCKLESKIPLYLRKSENLPISVLAVLKAGGCYVPLDPANPPARNEIILWDINASIGLTTSDLMESLPPTHLKRKWIQVDQLDFQGQSSQSLHVPGWSSRSLAYVMMSSGTTGTPKGIMLDHRAVVNGMMGVREYMRDPDGRISRVLQYSNYCFDVSGIDLWCSLTSGSILVMPNPADLLNDLAGTIASFKITHAALTPTVAGLISPDQTPSLRGLLVGGEAVPQSLVDTWASRVRLVEGWGPTETAIFCTARLVPPTDRNPAVLGHLYGATFGYVLDSNQRLVATGGLGEVYLGGPQLARGYLNAAELTARAFIPNPFTAENETWKTLYRTGDMCRQLADGSLEFVRRKDTQTKINGLRIELGEIETVISQAPEVKAAIVDVLEKNGTRMLAAWFAPSDACLPIEEAAQSMRARATMMLPPYMVPKQWFALDELPINKNGKADRRALFDLTARGQCRIAAADIASDKVQEVSTEAERVLQLAWADVLRLPLESIGRTQHFSQLGGDSVSVIMLVQRCRASGYLLTVPLALQFPVLKDMAEQLVNESTETFEKPVCLETVQESVDPTADTLFLVHAVEGLAIPFFSLRGHVKGNIVAINSPEFYSDAALKQPTVSDMADFYCKMILEHQTAGPYRIGGYSFGGLVALEIAHRLRARRHKVALVVLIDSVNHEFGYDEHNSDSSFTRIAEHVDAVINNTVKERTIPDSLLRSLRAEIAHNLGLMSSHEPQSSTAPVLLLRASEISSLGEDKGYQNGWTETFPNLKVIDVPGHHWTIFAPENVSELGHALQSALDASH
ncbi:hypothetical protein HDU88_004750 [Geranomyces variabilis]|nr:hypothetical protein HDU88_004750 [Geranomyces variabilis]